MKKAHQYRQKQEGAGLFELSDTLKTLSKLGNPLEAISQYVDFEMFRSALEMGLQREERKSKAGRRPIDPVLMFKVLFVQRLYGLSDEQTEYQIKDRMSFREFIGVESVLDVPDARTVWKYRNDLSHNGVYDMLFKRFYEYLESQGLILHSGKIMEASFMVSPRQRNTRQENAAIKSGCGESLWKEQPHKKCHKDTNARWAKKGYERFYGYKNHVKVCRKTKLITGYATTSASVHDSRCSSELIDNNDVKGEEFYMDSGYVGTEGAFERKGMKARICERGRRGHPLTKEQQRKNLKKARIRCRVEHVFGFMERTMGGLVFREVGLLRARAEVAMTNLIYNIARLVQIVKYYREWINPVETSIS